MIAKGVDDFGALAEWGVFLIGLSMFLVVIGVGYTFLSDWHAERTYKRFMEHAGEPQPTQHIPPVVPE